MSLDANASTRAFWNRVEALFTDALDLGAAERAGLLDEQGGDDDAVRAEVQSLLDAYARATAFMPPATASAEPDRLPARLHEGDTAGAFRLVRRIASGGMGTVYLAERMEGGFTQSVAVKVIAAAVAHEDAARRFRIERQILASLRHPYIVSLVDGGVTPRGEAYLVMELVEGVPITTYCREHGLDVRARLTLFRHVCDAVQYAHARSVIHRDLKPANILVTSDGVPKVLDFGVAKLVSDPGADGTDRTELGMGPLTPGYASPEQLRGLPITTASDIYALGIVLYELLAGVRPYETAGKPLDEVLKIVVESDTVRPSLATPDAHDSPPYDRRRVLKGDLDAIVLKALRKDPVERYASADAVSRDIGLWLDGQPVDAQVPSLGYVARKFVARHRLVFASASLSAVLVMAALGAALWQARVARTERDRAQAEAARARMATAFLGRVFQGANPVMARGHTVTARDLLDSGTASIRAELRDQPEVQAPLLLIMAHAYDGLSATDKAVPLAEQALALRERSHAPAADLGEAAFLLGALYRRQGRAAEAVPLLERSVSLREASLGPDDPDLASSLSQLALARDASGHGDGVLEIFQRAIRIRERATPKSALLGSLYNSMGAALQQRGDFAGARSAYQRSIAIYSASTDEENWGLMMPLQNLGSLLRDREEFDAARQLLERALELGRKTFGNESVWIADMLASLGDLARARGDLKAARGLLDESLRMHLRLLDPTHIALVAPLTYLARFHIATGHAPDAIPLLERALAISEKSHGPDHPEVASVLVDLAMAYDATGRLSAAEATAHRALVIERKVLAPDHVSLVPALTTLGHILIQQHRASEARPYLDEAVKIAAAKLPDHHSQRVDAEQTLKRAS
jgi:eukaryotic-like serine/threonine-protein kinase